MVDANNKVIIDSPETSNTMVQRRQVRICGGAAVRARGRRRQRALPCGPARDTGRPSGRRPVGGAARGLGGRHPRAASGIDAFASRDNGVAGYVRGSATFPSASKPKRRWDLHGGLRMRLRWERPRPRPVLAACGGSGIGPRRCGWQPGEELLPSAPAPPPWCRGRCWRSTSSRAQAQIASSGLKSGCRRAGGEDAGPRSGVARYSRTAS